FRARRNHSASRNAADSETERKLSARILRAPKLRFGNPKLRLDLRQNFRAIGGDGHGVFEMRGRFSIGGDDRPPVVKDFHLVCPEIDHWLDGKNETRLDLWTFAILNVIENGGIFVQRPANTVSTEFTDNPVMVCVGKLLNRG